MREILLTQGKVVLVSDEDYEELNKHKWYAYKCANTFYAQRTLTIGVGKYRTVRMHSIVMKTPKRMETDHINGNGLDNRRENLRVCTRSENLMNQKRGINNTSGYKGVSWHKGTEKWQSKIAAKGKRIYLGLFKEKEEAHKAYCEASKRYHGEFGNVYL